MVSGISLLDAVASSPSTYDADPPAERQVRIANELVVACLDEHRHIEALDACGPRKNWRWLHVRETESEMRKLHEQWLTRAAELLARAREMSRAGQPIERLEELRDAVGFTRAILGVTVDAIEHGRQQIRDGNFVTLQEARGDLRAAPGR